MRKLNIVFLAVFLIFTGGCGRGIVTGVLETESKLVTLERIEITPNSHSVPRNVLVDLEVTAIYSDQTSRDVTADVVWESSDTNIAVFNSSGALENQIKSMAAGAAQILAKFEGKQATAALTVNSAQLQSIQISPANSSIPAGNNQQMQATGIYDDATTVDLTSTVNWSSSNVAASTLSLVQSTYGLASGVASGVTVVTAALGGVSGTTNLTVTSATLTGISITPSAAAIAKGLHAQFSVMGTYSDSTQVDLTSSVIWTSSSPGIANLGGITGQFIGQGQGVATITATIGGFSDQAGLSVSSATLTSLAVSPSAATVAKGVSAQYTATGTFSDGTTQNLTSAVIWSSGNSNIFTVSNAISDHGLVLAKDIGSTSITASLSGMQNQTTVTVSSATLSTLAVSPVSGSIPAGRPQSFTVTGTYSDSTTADLTAAATWSTSNPSVGSISNGAGSKGSFVSTTAGATNITATIGSVSNQVSFTVDAAVLNSIAVSPSSPNPLVLGLGQQFTATGTYSDNSTADITASVAWNSSDPTVASISASGYVSSHNEGNVIISATAAGVNMQVPLEIAPARLSSVNVSPSSGSTPHGVSVQFTATGTYTDGTTADVTADVDWSVSAPAVAVIDSNGLLTTVAPGSLSVTAAAPTGPTHQVPFTVALPSLISVSLTPVAPTITLGHDLQLTATGAYTDLTTANLTLAANWSSSQGAVASVNAGLVESNNEGTATITATVSGVAGSTTVTIGSVQLTSIDITSISSTLALGLNQQFIATGIYTDFSTSDLTASVTWGSTSPLVALVGNIPGAKGLLTTLLPGTTNVTATLGLISAQKPFSVTAAELSSIAVTSPVSSIAKGLTVQFTATGTYTNGSTSDITSIVQWSTAPSNLASISNTAGSKGRLTASAVGGPIGVSAEYSSIIGSKNLNVTNATLVSIQVTPGAVNLLHGLGRQLTAMGTYTDGSVVNITNNVAWSTNGNLLCGINTVGYLSCVALTSGTASATLSGVSGNAVISGLL